MRVRLEALASQSGMEAVFRLRGVDVFRVEHCDRVADLPTAFYISAVEIPKSTMVGQFQPESGEQEEFGSLFEKGSPLVSCVNEALAPLRAMGRSSRSSRRGSPTWRTCPSSSEPPVAQREGLQRAISPAPAVP